MLDVFKQYATDATAEEDGVIVEIMGSKFTVARAGNLKYNQILTRLTEQNQIALDNEDPASDDISSAIMIEVMANSILLGWEDVMYDGKVLKYSVANAMKLLKLKDFRREINNASMQMNRYRVAAQEKEVKNSDELSSST